MSMHHAITPSADRPGPLAVGNHAARLTHKQADVLSYFYVGQGYADGDPEPYMLIAHKEIAQFLRECLDDDLHAGKRPAYWGVSSEGIYACCLGMATRGLIRRVGNDWQITQRGVDVCELLGIGQ